MPLQPLNRRAFLRAAGVAVGLPLLDAMIPASARGAKKALDTPRRMVLIGRPLGMYAPNFFPERIGVDYEPSRYLKLLEPMRKHFTVISGMSHRYAAGHFAEVGLFTGVHPDFIRPSDIRNTISLDQEAASHFAGLTRFACLNLGGGDVVWNRRGVRVPSEQRATQVFKQLFLSGTPEEQARELRRISEGQSILDEVRGEVASMKLRLGDSDRRRLDLYLSSIREAEQRLQQDAQWSATPKPHVDFPPPTGDLNGPQLVARSRQWLDIVRLALQTDSTRVLTLHLGSQDQSGVDGVTLAHHDASHHGQEPTKLEQLALIEEAEVGVFGEFLAKLHEHIDGDRSLLDRTAVFYTSNLGNSSSHDNTNLPIILAGGAFKHRGHLGYDRKNNMLLSNLYVRMLQQLGIEAEKFGSSTGVLSDV
ncbi:MAG: DUF1552 domain-containing protein [Planctomycetaceae bacterium]|nr:DUF1552 domain-containing protein [Planctomycetaceae bacterium]